MDAITRRVAARLRYLDPRRTLILASARRTSLAAFGAPQSLIDNRPRELEGLRFTTQAAFFAYACAQAETDGTLAFAMHEAADMDCIFRRGRSGARTYEAVQLKEIPPAETNGDATLETQLARLASTYADSPELRVGIYLNREMTVPLGELVVPEIRVGSVWLYGVSADHANTGFLLGDILPGRGRTLYHFPLPALPSSLTQLQNSIQADSG